MDYLKIIEGNFHKLIDNTLMKEHKKGYQFPKLNFRLLKREDSTQVNGFGEFNYFLTIEDEKLLLYVNVVSAPLLNEVYVIDDSSINWVKEGRYLEKLNKCNVESRIVLSCGDRDIYNTHLQHQKRGEKLCEQLFFDLEEYSKSNQNLMFDEWVKLKYKKEYLNLIEENFHELLKKYLNNHPLPKLTNDLLTKEEFTKIPGVDGGFSYFLAIEKEKVILYVNFSLGDDINEAFLVDEISYLRAIWVDYPKLRNENKVKAYDY